jgi:sulfate/thiosulfate-binding protein
MQLLTKVIFLLLLAQNLFASNSILNVSYDPTRELYKEINISFEEQYFETYKKKIYVNQSHGGSGKQANALLHGLKGDVVTLASFFDLDKLTEKEIISLDWRKKFLNNSSPYSSIIVFLVKKGNPKNIYDWDDLIKDNIEVITPNPKISGGAIWNYLAAYAYTGKKYNNEESRLDFLKKLFKNVPMLDTTSRNATITFTERKRGDVLISWENEALLVVNKLKKGEYEIVYPSITMQIDAPVAISEKITKMRDSYDVAKEYVDFLYKEKGQEIIGKNYYRPYNLKILKEFRYFAFPHSMNIVKIEDLGDWDDIQKIHFSENGFFDNLHLGSFK